MGILLFAEILRVLSQHHPSSLVDDNRQRDGRLRPTTPHPNEQIPYWGAVSSLIAKATQYVDAFNNNRRIRLAATLHR